MGEFRFRLPDDWTLAARQASSIHVVGLDGIPWPCKIQTEDQVLGIRRLRDESGKTYVAYPFEKWGEIVVCTGTLLERPEPYDFVTEIARGTVNRLRNQISIWQEGGLEIDGPVLERTAAAIGQLGSAIMSSEFEDRDKFAAEALELAMQSIFDLGRIFGEQIADFRCQHNEFATFWLANNSQSRSLPSTQGNGDLAQVQQMFELVQLAPSLENGQVLPSLPGELDEKKKIIGPLLDASPGGLSNELGEAENFEARKSRLINLGRRVISELPDSSAMIHVACGLNGLGHRQLSYPQQLQTVVDLLQMIEDSPVECPTMISFDFPWGERLASSVGGIHPLQIADTLLRQGVDLSFIGLDINLDYWPGGSALRDPLQWIDLIDVWSQLGKPLVICLRMPSQQERLSSGATLSSDQQKLVNEIRGGLTDQQRLNAVATVLPMLVARPSVHGLIWRQLTDLDDYRYPSAGLLDSESHAKPTAELISGFRAETLGRRP